MQQRNVLIFFFFLLFQAFSKQNEGLKSIFDLVSG